MRFFLGDDNGQLKSVTCTRSLEKEWKVDTTLLDDGGKQGKTRAVQELTVKGGRIALARGDGSAALYSVKEHTNAVQVVQQWREDRFKDEHHYVGLGISDNGVISCTSAGHLRLTHAPENESESSSQATAISNRLAAWVLSDDIHSFAYGGDEVEVSMWDTSRAFDPSRRLLPCSAAGVKRKKGSELIDGEIWRAKNVSNDFLNLRQPVHNTSLVYLSPTSSRTGSSHHILAGTRLGSVRRYDTRAGRKPVADWKDVCKVGGIRKVQRGNSDREAFVADHGSNLLALDLRTGRVLYAYSGIAGAISSLAHTTSSLSPSLLASTSLDRFFRLHSTYRLPEKSGTVIDKKGEVVAKVWLKSAASCVTWDGVVEAETRSEEADEDGEEEGDIWARMQDVGEDEDAESSISESEGEHRGRKRRNKNS